MLRSLVLLFCLSFASSAYSQDSFEGLQDKIDEAQKGSLSLKELVEKTMEEVDRLKENETISESLDLLENFDDSSIGELPWKERLRESSKGQLLVFVSFSMDDELLQDYMIEAGRYDARLVLRGLSDGDMGAALSRMTNLIKPIEHIEGVRGVSIDPRGFDLHGVDVVPTIILSEKSYETCSSDPCLDVGLVDRMTGAVTIKYALEQFVNSGDNKAFAKSKF